MELAHQVGLYADTLPGLEQYGAKRFAIALEGFVKILADNTGVKSNETVAELYSQHSKGNKNAGFNIEVCILLRTCFLVRMDNINLFFICFISLRDHH